MTDEALTAAKEETMFPGMNDTDCEIAKLHYAQLVTEGQRQQAAADIRPTTAASRPEWTAVQRRVGTFLVQIGQRLQDAYAVETPGLGSDAATERVVA